MARGQTLAALQQNGLTLVHGDARETVAVNAQQDPAALGVQDVVAPAGRPEITHEAAVASLGPALVQLKLPA